MTSWTPPPPDAVPRDAAQAWLLRLISGEMTEVEVRQCQTWRAADPKHEAAFQRVHSVWLATKTMAPALREGARPRRRAGRQLARHPMWAAGLAAAALLLAIVVPWRDWSAEYRTSAGQIAREQLPDGSVAWLDTGSALKLEYVNGQRRVELLHGQAWFEVRHDPAHPFQVKAGGGTATDVGTVFDMRAERGRAEIAVISGAVRLDWQDEHRLLTGGQAATYETASGLSKTAALDPDAVLAWRQGRLIFAGKPLSAVLAEMNRYSKGRIVLLSDSAASQPVSAIMQVNGLDTGLAALAETQGLRVTRLPYLTLLTAQK